MKRLAMFLVLMLAVATAALAGGNPAYGNCSPNVGAGFGCVSSYYWACINNSAFYVDYSTNPPTYGYDCWAVDSCQEAFCYNQCAPGTGTGCAPTHRGPDHTGDRPHREK